MKLIGPVLLTTIITFQYTNSVQIVEKSNIKNEARRFEPSWDSLDSRELPKW